LFGRASRAHPPIDRTKINSDLIDGEDSMLFESLLHLGDAALAIHNCSNHPNELEFMIAALSGRIIPEVELINIHQKMNLIVGN
jgi:hypothetical protein